MPAKRLAAPSAFEAHDVIAPDRLSYRDGGCPGAGCFRFRLAETGESLMNIRDQSADLVSPDLMSPNICGHNLRGKFPIGRYGRLVVGHRILPVSKHNMPVKSRALIKASPYAFVDPPTIHFGFRLLPGTPAFLSMGPRGREVSAK